MLLLLLFTIKNRFSFLFDFLRLPRTLGSPLILFSFLLLHSRLFVRTYTIEYVGGGGMLLKSIEKPKAKRRKKSSSSPKAIKVVCVCVVRRLSATQKRGFLDNKFKSQFLRKMSLTRFLVGSRVRLLSMFCGLYLSI